MSKQIETTTLPTNEEWAIFIASSGDGEIRIAERGEVTRIINVGESVTIEIRQDNTDRESKEYVSRQAARILSKAIFFHSDTIDSAPMIDKVFSLTPIDIISKHEVVYTMHNDIPNFMIDRADTARVVTRSLETAIDAAKNRTNRTGKRTVVVERGPDGKRIVAHVRSSHEQEAIVYRIVEEEPNE